MTESLNMRAPSFFNKGFRKSFIARLRENIVFSTQWANATMESFPR
jgi:hypothetical protein